MKVLTEIKQRCIGEKWIGEQSKWRVPKDAKSNYFRNWGIEKRCSFGYTWLDWVRHGNCISYQERCKRYLKHTTLLWHIRHLHEYPNQCQESLNRGQSSGYGYYLDRKLCLNLCVNYAVWVERSISWNAPISRSRSSPKIGYSMITRGQSVLGEFLHTRPKFIYPSPI